MLSDLIYGTWRLLDENPAPRRDDIRRRFELCLELGITSIDTAEIYGLYQVEEAIGEVFSSFPDLREKMQVVTKAGIEVPSAAKPQATLAHYNATADHLVRCAEASLKRLATDRIDLFLVHRPDWLTTADETAEGLNRLIRDGKILHAGVSNYTWSQFDLLADRVDAPLFTNQLEMSLLCQEAMQDGTLAQCEKARTRPMAWSPLGGGRLFSTQDEAAARIRNAMEKMRSRYDHAGDDALAMAWVLAHPSRPHVILGTNQEERVRSQAVASGIKLERQDWYALWEAAAGHPVP